MAASQAAGVGAGSPFILEAHYYAGGLRVKPLGSQAHRPPWVPPADYVGLGHEITLEREDLVVEFARFLFGGCRTTWVAVFSKAVDEVFGDRKNYAGVGVWLLERTIADAPRLLRGLSQLAIAVAEGKVESIGPHADVFAGADYLPRYLMLTEDLPDQLGGVPYDTTGVPAKAAFHAMGKDSSEALDLAAEQILRLSILGADEPSCSRAFILVSAVAANQQNPRPGLRPVKRGFAGELLIHAPRAMRDISDRSRALAGEVQALTHQLGARDSMLREEQEANASLQARLGELELQLEETDVLTRLARIDTRLGEISKCTSTLEGTADRIRSDVVALRESVKRLETSRIHRQQSEQVSVGAYTEEKRRVSYSVVAPWHDELVRKLAFVIFLFDAVLVVAVVWDLLVGGIRAGQETPSTSRELDTSTVMPDEQALPESPPPDTTAANKAHTPDQAPDTAPQADAVNRAPGRADR